MACLGGCLLSTCSLATAQPLGKLEVWGGVTVAAPWVDSALTTSYVPRIDRYSPPLEGSQAGQTVRLTSGNAVGFEVGANLFFGQHVGVQVLVDRDRFDLTATGGDYEVLLNYTAMQPPDYLPRLYSFSRSYLTCDRSPVDGCVRPTSGSLRRITLGFDLVGRWPLGKHVRGGLAAGVSYFDRRGEGQPLRYTLFGMGGHSTLFSGEYQLAYSIGPAHGFGFNAGGNIDIDLRGGVSLAADVRYFGGPDLSAPVVVTDVLNKNSLASPQEAAAVQEVLQPPAVRLSPATLRIMVGLKVRR